MKKNVISHVNSFEIFYFYLEYWHSYLYYIAKLTRSYAPAKKATVRPEATCDMNINNDNWSIYFN